jgi:hypothetical protein
VKLKFERFEGLTSFSIRGNITVPEVKILQIGLDSLVKQLETPLIVNLVLADIPDVLAPVLLVLKKSLPPQTKHKIHWISTMKNVGDFPTLNAFISRLTGFKHRQIGERLIIDDQIHLLHEEVAQLKVKVLEASGDEAKAHELILQNQILKEQERILKSSITFQKERLKLQTHVPTQDEESVEKLKTVRQELKKAYGMDLDL